MRGIFLIALPLLLFAVLLYALMGSSVSVDKEETAAVCRNEVFAAQDASQEKICTQEITLLACGKYPSFTYEASNGCEKSYLEGKGWK